MRAEVIAIGDELISGQRVDTNSAWISERLAELGVPVTYHTTVGDDLEANTRVRDGIGRMIHDDSADREVADPLMARPARPVRCVRQ